MTRVEQSMYISHVTYGDIQTFFLFVFINRKCNKNSPLYKKQLSILKKKKNQNKYN